MADNLTDPAELKVLDAINCVSNALYTTPLKFRILSALGSDSAAGTAYSGSTDQTITFASGGTSSNGQTWASLATGDVVGYEIYDSAGTPARIWWGVFSPVNATAQATGDTITAAAHGLTNGQRVIFQPAFTPAGLTAGTKYFVVGATTNTFQVATTSGGTAVDITADSTTVTYGIVKSIANTGDSFIIASGGVTTSLS